MTSRTQIQAISRHKKKGRNEKKRIGKMILNFSLRHELTLRNVSFFSSHGVYLTNKRSLSRVLHCDKSRRAFENVF